MEPTHAVQLPLNTCISGGCRLSLLQFLILPKEEGAGGFVLGIHPSHVDPTLLKSIAISICVVLIRQK